MTNVLKSLALVLLVAIAACAQPTVPKDYFYRINVTVPERVKTPPLFKGTIEVQRFVADGLTAGRPIVYSDAGNEHQLQEYHYHFWTEPPIVMLQDQLIDYLRAENVADMIVPPEMRVIPDYRLTAKIKRFEKIVGAKPSALAELELGLQDEKTGKIIHLANYRVEVGASSQTVGDAVIAMSKALTEIYSRFVASLK